MCASHLTASQHTQFAAVVLNTGIQAPSAKVGLAAHGILMFLAFSVAMLWGTGVARYVKNKPSWFPLHWISQVAGAALAVAALIVVMLELKADSGEQMCGMSPSVLLHLSVRAQIHRTPT